MKQLLRAGLAVAGILFSAIAGAQQCDFEDPALMLRPGIDAGPTPVQVRLYVNDIIEIRDVEQSFVADVVMRAEWTDLRLVHAEPAGCTAGLEQVWSPRLQAVNLRNLDRLREPQLRVSPAGEVSFVMRGVGEFSFLADLSDFPFDTQVFGFVLVSSYGPEAVSVESSAELIGFAEHFSTSNWLVKLAGVESGSRYFAATDRHLAELRVNLQGTRLTGYYTWKLIVPLMLVVLMSWSVFWLAPVHVAPRTGLAATAMLTLIAYRFALASILPPIAYLTRMDLFLVFASILVFAALAVAVAVTYVADQGRVAQANTINLVARWLSPLLFVVVLVLAFWF